MCDTATAIINTATVSLSFISAIAASASAVFAFRQVKVQREHNQKTVRPCLEFQTASDTINGRKIQRLTLSNHGFGPAIIKAYKVIKKGQVIAEERSPATLAVEYGKSRGVYLATLRSSRPGLDGVIAAGQKVVLFEIEVKEFMNDVAGEDDDIEIMYDYISIYDDKYSVTTEGNHFKL